MPAGSDHQEAQRPDPVLKVLDRSFEFEGRRFTSLSAIAGEVTGARWYGFAFFALDPEARPETTKRMEARIGTAGWHEIRYAVYTHKSARKRTSPAISSRSRWTESRPRPTLDASSAEGLEQCESFRVSARRQRSACPKARREHWSFQSTIAANPELSSSRCTGTASVESICCRSKLDPQVGDHSGHGVDLRRSSLESPAKPKSGNVARVVGTTAGSAPRRGPNA